MNGNARKHDTNAGCTDFNGGCFRTRVGLVQTRGTGPPKQQRGQDRVLDIRLRAFSPCRARQRVLHGVIIPSDDLPAQALAQVDDQGSL